MVTSPKFSVLKTEYGPVNGITIKEYHEVVHWGWYVVKATLEETYEEYYTDKDEEGFEAYYCKVRKECHEEKALVKRSYIRHALAARRERVYAKVAAILDFISPPIQALRKRLRPKFGVLVLQYLVHADDLDPDVLRWLWMKKERLETPRETARRPCRNARRLSENPWAGLQ